MRGLVLTAAATAFVLLSAACGGTVQREVKGASFELSRKEADLADQYDREEPRRADAAARCEYWKKRVDDAGKDHVIGPFEYSPESFVHLRAWAEAEKTDLCGAAEREADAKAAKTLEDERATALANARQAHDGRDREGWATARAEQCAAAATEDACDGVRAYLRAFPEGSHVAQAGEALGHAAPKLEGLRHAREEEEQRRASATAKLEDAAGLRVSGVRVAMIDAPGGDGQLLRVTFDLTALRALARGTTPLLKAACRVGDKRRVDVASGLDARVSELDPGDTKQIEASVYAKGALASAPSECDLVLMKGGAADTSGTVVHTFCYVPGQRVRDGACTP
jgi:hypothetical protein